MWKRLQIPAVRSSSIKSAFLRSERDACWGGGNWAPGGCAPFPPPLRRKDAGSQGTTNSSVSPAPTIHLWEKQRESRSVTWFKVLSARDPRKMPLSASVRRKSAQGWLSPTRGFPEPLCHGPQAGVTREGWETQNLTKGGWAREGLGVWD